MVKSKFMTIVLLTIISVATYAQDMMQSIFEPKAQITWVGLDLTRAKFIGDRERWGSTSDVQRYMEAWNDLIIKEKDKYNIAKALDKEEGTVQAKVDITKEHNANLDVTEFFSDNKADHMRFRPNDIVEIVSDYDFKDATGVGLMFVVESFSKLNNEGSIWITFINLGTKEVLFSERMIGQPGGFGMRNFWAASVYDILTRMKKKEFEMWRKKYYRK